MKSNLFKIIILLVSLFLVSMVFPGKAMAYSPELQFRVVNQNYIDYSNQVLKWTENGHLWWRYEQSGSNGRVNFDGWSDYYNNDSKYRSLSLKDCRSEIVSSGVNCSLYDTADCRTYDATDPQKAAECNACQLKCTDSSLGYQNVNCSSLPTNCYSGGGNPHPIRCQGRCNSCRQVAEGMKTILVNGSPTNVNFTGGSCVVDNPYQPPAKLVAGQFNAFGCGKVNQGQPNERDMNPQYIDIVKNPGDTGNEYFIKITRNASDCTNSDDYFQNAASGTLGKTGGLPEVTWSYSGAPSNRLTVTVGNVASQFIGCIKYVTPPKTCSVTVNPVTVGVGQTTRVTLTGNAYYYGSQLINLWLERKTGQVINNYWKSSVLSPQPVIPWGINPFYYDVVSGACVSTNYNQCTKAVDLKAPEGDYWLHCDIPFGSKPCSGNPFCTYNGGSVNCSGWVSCGPNDHVAFKVGGTPTPSCTATLDPSFKEVFVSATQPYTATVTPLEGTGTVEKVEFSVTPPPPPTIATVSPTIDPSSPYLTELNAVALGNATVRADVYMKNNAGISVGKTCFATASVHINNVGPWWQVKDADVTTTATSADLISLIPADFCTGTCTPVFGLKGPGGYPGVPIYVRNYDFDLSPSEVGDASENNWLVNTQTSLRTSYDYTYFEKLIPADATISEIPSNSETGDYFTTNGTADSKGYYWFRYDGASSGDFNITSDASLGTRKIILFVKNADLNLSGKINFTKGSGFFMTIVGKNSGGEKGNITVAGTVGGNPGTGPQLEGVYLAENVFNTGLGSSQLHVKGSVVAYGGIELHRTLADNTTTPAELFEYYPEEMFAFPPSFNTKKIQWKEAAP